MPSVETNMDGSGVEAYRITLRGTYEEEIILILDLRCRSIAHFVERRTPQ